MKGLERTILRAKGFSLAELLVVITVIAILGALLMPALKSARNRVKTVTCATHERQIGAAMNSYLNDHDGYYPWGDSQAVLPNGPSGGPLTNLNVGWSQAYIMPWVQAISPYLGYNQAFNTVRPLFQCPANPWPFPTTPTYTRPSGNSYVWSYALNTSMFPINWVAIGGAPQPPPNYLGWCRKIRVTEISAPSAVCNVGEIPYSPDSKNPYGVELGGDWNRAPLSYYSFVANPAGVGIPYTAMNTCTPCASWFHSFSMNCLFVDGRVELMSHSTLTNYATAVSNGGPCPAGICAHYYVGDGSPGCYFWTDNRGIYGAYANQEPGGPYGMQYANQ